MTLNWIKRVTKLLIVLTIIAFSLSCTDKVFDFKNPDGSLNGPISSVVYTEPSSGENFLVVINSNYRLAYENAWISTVHLGDETTTPIINKNSFFSMKNFSSQIEFDTKRNYFYVTNREEDALFVLSPSFDSSTNLLSLTGVDIDGEIAGTQSSVELSKNPFGIAILNNGAISDRAYVTNISSSDLAVLSLDTFKLIDVDPEDDDAESTIFLNIPVRSFVSQGLGAHKMVIDSSKKFGYVTSAFSHVIFVIDLEDNIIEGYIYLFEDDGTALRSSTFTGSRGLALATNGILYVANRRTNSIYLVDTTKVTDNGVAFDTIENAVIATLPLSGNGPSDIALSPDEKFLYVANFTSNTVSVIDLTLQTIIREIEVGKGPTNISVGTKRLYVINFLSDSISVIDLATNTIVMELKNE